MYKALVIVMFFCLNLNGKNLSWIGKWTALDEWRSEYSIEIFENGNALSDYGNGENGEWRIVDGNLEIIWRSGRKDYIFSGVMGIQRLSDFKGKKYTTGMKKLPD